MGPRAGLDFWRTEKSLDSARIQTLDGPARSLVTIRTAMMMMTTATTTTMMIIIIIETVNREVD